MTNEQIANFFSTQAVQISGNPSLRTPQQEGHHAIHAHFVGSREPGYVQLPVGCGKTGLMGLTPFGLTQGRVLIVAPNLIIRGTILRELNVSDPNCFYAKRGVFTPSVGPFISELKTGANMHDCDEAHIVVANIQQFAGANNKWYEKFPPDYFKMILIDEGHHNVAETWRRLTEYFSEAIVVSFTATPMRSDGQLVEGKRIYAFSYLRSMMSGFISPIDAVYVRPSEVTFTAQGVTRTLSLEEVLTMREHDWFSKGIALSETSNRHIVNAAIQQLHEVRKHGTPRQIIAATCSIRHAEQVASLFREHGLTVEVLHSGLTNERREEIERGLRNGTVDVVAQVQILGEGYDLGTLAVAAVFRPYRSLSPYIQFVGRILRLAIPDAPFSPGNRVYLVSHVGLNDERWWEDFKRFDAGDQLFFSEFLSDGDDTTIEESGPTPRMTLRPFMRVLNETIEEYVQKGFLTKIDEVLAQELLDAIRAKGFDPGEFGLTPEIMRMRLELANKERVVPAFNPLVQPQKKREALRLRLVQEARSIADVVINRLELKHAGKNLIGRYPSKGDSNASILIALAAGYQNRKMGIESGERESASAAQYEAAISASADIADALTAEIRNKR